MAKQKVFERVLEVLIAADGGAVTKEYLLKELEGDIVANRVSTYFWEIKTKDIIFNVLHSFFVSVTYFC